MAWVHFEHLQQQLLLLLSSLLLLLLQLPKSAIYQVALHLSWHQRGPLCSARSCWCACWSRDQNSSALTAAQPWLTQPCWPSMRLPLLLLLLLGCVVQLA
jgi:hypothetical protein